MVGFQWNDEKDALLQRERGLSFQMVVDAVEQGDVIDDVLHFSPLRQNQRILIVRVLGQICAVPYVTDGDTKFLKTIYVSRDMAKKYGVENG